MEEILIIMDIVNFIFVGENIVFSDEFIGFEEVIYVIFYVGYVNCLYFLIFLIILYLYVLYKYNL